MEEGNTEWLRSAAPRWSLAGDEQLLQALQVLHQRIMCRCAETSSRLEAMVAALDGASLALHNVNNKFMSLSNRQFVESRVYEDDGDVVASAAPPHAAPATAGEQPTEVDRLMVGLRMVERHHEVVTILRDSDSDTGSDGGGDVDRVVLKPRQQYAARPLPHIIGTRAWRDKWHAGLLLEESDTESSCSGPREQQYSSCSSDVELEPADLLEGRAACRSSVSGTSSELSAAPPAPLVPAPPSAPTAPAAPAAVAAELARRLGAVHMPQPLSATDPDPPPAAPRKLYKPHQPAPGAVFPDEPPPLDSERSVSDEDSGPEDIFAELHKQPYARGGRGRSRVADELFGGAGGSGPGEGGVFSDVVDTGGQVAAHPPTSIFQDEPAPEVSTGPPPAVGAQDAHAAKKPVGGVSVFGGRGAAKSIGDAILRRNQRPPSSSEDDDSTGSGHRQRPEEAQAQNAKLQRPDKAQVKSIEPATQANIQRDIFDDLFARSEQLQRKTAQKELEKQGNKEVKAEEIKKVDLFSDDLFDDIDDIFSSTVPRVPVKMPDKREKPLFDDDDDLFADIVVAKNDNVDRTEIKVSEDAKSVRSQNKTSIFYSDDDLFNEKPAQEHNAEKKITKISEVTKTTETSKVSEVQVPTKISKETKSLFDDSDDDIFTNVKLTKPAQDMAKTKVAAKGDIENEPSDAVVNISQTIQDDVHDKTDLFNDDSSDLFLRKNANNKTKVTPRETASVVINYQNDDIFSGRSKLMTKPTNNSSNLFDDKMDKLLVENSKNKEQTPDLVKNDKTSANDKVNYEEMHENDRTIETKTKIETNNDQVTTRNEKIYNDTGGMSNTDKTISENSIAIDEVTKVKNINFTKVEDTNLQNDNFDEVVEDDLCAKPDRDNHTLNLGSNKSEMIEDESMIPGKPKQIQRQLFKDHDNDLFRNDRTADKMFVDSTKNKNKTIEISVDKPIPKRSETKTTHIENNTPVLDNIQTESIPTVTKIKIQSANNTKLDNMREVDANQNITESESTESEPDIFTDVFPDLPPEFEKPKESKKSKNVNALFDDDSDDEALFFKKNDVILDEKPDDFSSNTNVDLFGIFHDEPPAIDVDLVQKSDKVDVFGDNEPVDRFKISDESFLGNDNAVENKSNDEIFSNNDVYKNSDDLFPQRRDERKIDDVPLPELPKPTVIDKPDGAFKTQTVETKKVGKLKPMNFNINVNSLLPGASPKKTKEHEKTDGQISTKSNEELLTDNLNDKELESKLVKSVSFEGDPDSPVLDNKLSKDRAKIQVKRRPSTRRARREAVKKTGIDFGDDSTDNSSSIDDPPRTKSTDKRAQVSTTVEKTEDLPQSNGVEEKELSEPKCDNKSLCLDSKNSSSTNDSSKMKESTGNKPSEENHTNVDGSRNLLSNTKDVKSKVVYILNDEDIFNTKPTQKPENSDEIGASVVRSKILQVVDDDDDIFKDMMSATNVEKGESKLKPETIKTSGKVYTESAQNVKQTKPILNNEDDDIFKDIAKVETVPKTQTNENNESNLIKNKTVSDKTVTKIREAKAVANKTSIFDDLSDEENELFNKNKTTGTKTSKMFNSDSEEDLFAGKSMKDTDTAQREMRPQRESEEIKREPKKVVKDSLFGDDDDDDLFGSKPKKTPAEARPQGLPPAGPQRPAAGPQPHAMEAEPVFADPLSILGADDD